MSRARTAFFFGVAAPVTFLSSLCGLLGGLLKLPRGFHDGLYRAWSQTLLWAAGVRIRVEGVENLEPGRPLVLVCNHQSLLDIPALFAALPVSLRFVAKLELSRIPVFSAAMRQGGHVFIDRGDRGQAIEAMREAGRRMRREGLSLCLFPEGTRSPDGRLQAFKRGSFVLAIQTGTTIVPVALEGGASILRKRSLRVEPGVLDIRCGEPIPVDGLTAEDRAWMTRHAREAIAAMLGDLRRRRDAPAE